MIAIASAARADVVNSLTDAESALDDGHSPALPLPTPPIFRYEGWDRLEAVESFQRDFLDRELGDGFPLIPPTGEAVAAMLAGTCPAGG